MSAALTQSTIVIEAINLHSAEEPGMYTLEFAFFDSRNSCEMRAITVPRADAQSISQARISKAPVDVSLNNSGEVIALHINGIDYETRSL